ncbi:MAG: DUF5110 domain-containing protein, partial [Lacisediminihabitans sp.]
YEDDNETYSYEKGQRATCNLVWEDATRTFHVSARQGSFPGLVAHREFHLVLIVAGGNIERTLHYDGQSADVKLVP